MPRKPRCLVDQGFYHLLARGNNRLFLFKIDEGFSYFKELLKTSKALYSWKLHHYCLMSNHIHLLGRIERGSELPRLMQYLLQTYARWYRTKTGYLGHLWQGRYKSPLIGEETYFLECGRYIERNPVRAGIVKNARDYPWSSYRFYAEGEEDALVDEDPYYQPLGQDLVTRQKNYREFVQIDGPYDKIVDQTLIESAF